MKKEIAVIAIIGWLIIIFAMSACGPAVRSNPHPVAGLPGDDGEDGTNGHSALIEQLSSDTCPNSGIIIITAIDINDSFTIDPEDRNIQSTNICNGVKGNQGDSGDDGEDGHDGAAAPVSPFIPVKMVTACGPESSPYKEVLLVLANGSVLASFSETVEGRNTRLALIPDGNYANTDSSGCHFSLSTSGSTRTCSWTGGSESWEVQ